MAIVKYDSNRAFPAFSSLFDDFFNTEFGNWRHNNFSATNTTLPAVNIKEDNDGFSVEMAAPGMEKADFKINLENNVLTISSEKQEEQKEEQDKYTRREFAYRAFQRSFTLPDSADSEKIEAKYENGVLHVNIPKKEEAKPQPPKLIEIS